MIPNKADARAKTLFMNLHTQGLRGRRDIQADGADAGHEVAQVHLQVRGQVAAAVLAVERRQGARAVRGLAQGGAQPAHQAHVRHHAGPVPGPGLLPEAHGAGHPGPGAGLQPQAAGLDHRHDDQEPQEGPAHRAQDLHAQGPGTSAESTMFGPTAEVADATFNWKKRVKKPRQKP